MLEIIRLLGTRRRPEWESRTRIREVGAFNDEFDALWARTTGDFPISVLRDRAYLTWRYLENPVAEYVILIAERARGMAGYAVLSLRALETRGVVAIAELLVAPGDEAAGLDLLAGAEACARQLGAMQLQCWMTPGRRFYRHLLRQRGFVFLPFRVLPGILHYTTSFIVRPRPGTSLAPDPGQLGNWFLAMGDQDTV